MATFPENYTFAQGLVGSLADWYRQEIPKHQNKDPELVVRLMVVALTQYAAMLAVDVGMTEDQFNNVSRSQFGEAYRKAPKFG